MTKFIKDKKAFIIDIWKDATLSIRAIGARNKKFPNALPVYSIDKKEDAEMLQTLLCSRTTDGRYVMNKFAGGNLELEDLDEVGDFLDRAHRKYNLKEEGVDFRAWWFPQALKFASYSVMEMTESQFWHHFRPIKNHLDDNAAHEGCMFETYGAEIDFVRSQEPNLVWTIVEGDNDTMFFLKGFHLVNRLGFFITEVPWTDTDEDVQCDMEGEEEQGIDMEEQIDEKLKEVRAEYGESIGPEEAFRIARNMVQGE